MLKRCTGTLEIMYQYTLLVLTVHRALTNNLLALAVQNADSVSAIENDPLTGIKPLVLKY